MVFELVVFSWAFPEKKALRPKFLSRTLKLTDAFSSRVPAETLTDPFTP
jgi:hypothetical protein